MSPHFFLPHQFFPGINPVRLSNPSDLPSGGDASRSGSHGGLATARGLLEADAARERKASALQERKAAAAAGKMQGLHRPSKETRMAQGQQRGRPRPLRLSRWSSARLDIGGRYCLPLIMGVPSSGDYFFHRQPAGIPC
jgi:hypothetical protein